MKRKLRDLLKLISAYIFVFLYIPHLFVYFFTHDIKMKIDADLSKRISGLSIRVSTLGCFIFFIHNDRYFRTLFYHRVGPIVSLFIGWWRPGDRYFTISSTTQIGKGAYFIHPFSTIINAKSIGPDFSCRHLTTIGNKHDGDNDARPTIGKNVVLGANVSIIGDVSIGDNVIIGAGSVVVKDIPSNCIAVGNPCKPIKNLE